MAIDLHFSKALFALPFFVEVCTEVSSSAVYSVPTPRKSGECFTDGHKISGRTPLLTVPWQLFTQRQEETH